MPVVGGQFVRERFLRGAQAVAAGGRFQGPSGLTLLPQLRGGGRVAQVGRQLSGNPNLLRQAGTDRLVGAGEFDFGTEAVEAPQTRLQDLLLSQEQQAGLQRFQRTAAGRGIQGGALQSSLQGQIDRLLAVNRAQGFSNIAGEAQQAARQASGLVRPFLQQVGQLGSAFGTSSGAEAQIGQLGSGNLQEFAQPLIQALAGLGQNRALVAGLGLGEVSPEQFQLSGQERGLAAAVRQFINPSLTEEQLRTTATGRDRFGRRRGRGFRQFARARELSASRIQAGEFLAEALEPPVAQAQRAAQELTFGSRQLSGLLAGEFAAGGTGRRARTVDLPAPTISFRPRPGGSFRIQPLGFNF